MTINVRKNFVQANLQKKQEDIKNPKITEDSKETASANCLPDSSIPPKTPTIEYIPSITITEDMMVRPDNKKGKESTPEEPAQDSKRTLTPANIITEPVKKILTKSPTALPVEDKPSTSVRTSDWIDSNGNKAGTYEYISDADGKLILRKKYDLNNNLISITNYFYDESGNIINYSIAKFREDGSYSDTFYDKDWVALEKTNYTKDNKKVSRSVFQYDSDGIKTSVIKTNYDISSGVTNATLSYSYDKAGNITGYIKINHDKNGTEKSGTVYQYSKNGQEKTTLARYNYNNDGTVSLSVYKDNESCFIGTFNQDEFAAENPAGILSRIVALIDGTPSEPEETESADNTEVTTVITTSDWKDSAGNKIGTYEYEKNSDGKILTRKSYDLNGNLKSVLNYIYDDSGNLEKYLTRKFNDDGTYSDTLYDKDWKALEVSKFNSDGMLTAASKYSYDKNGEKVGYTETKYDTNGQNTTTTVYQYNKESQKYVAQTNYVYNNDNTVTLYTYNEGKKYFAGKINKGEITLQDSADLSKTTTTDWKNSDGNKLGTYVYERNTDGKMLLRKSYDTNGKLQSILNNIYDDSGNVVNYSTTKFNDNGTYSNTVYDKDWKALEYTAFNQNNKVTSNTSYAYDSDGIKATMIKTEYDVSSSKVKQTLSYAYDKAGNIAGYVSVNYDSNGKETTATVYQYDKEREKYNSLASYNYNSDGTITVKLTKLNKQYSVKVNQDEFDIKNPAEIISKIITMTDEIQVAALPDIPDNVTMSILVKTIDKNGKIHKQTVEYNAENLALYTSSINADGSSTYVYYIKTVTNDDGTTTEYTYNTLTGAVTTGNGDVGRSRLTKGKIIGSTSGMSVTMSSKDIYNSIIDPYGRSAYIMSNISVMKHVDGFGTFSEMCLKLASNEFDYGQNTPFEKRLKTAKSLGGCDKVYDSYSETEYSDYIKQELTDALSVYGYEPEWVKGYNFPTNSILSKTISNPSNGTIDSDLKNLIKTNISRIINGRFPIGSAFNTNKDLYYSIHGFNAIGGKISGTTLTLTLFDIYDFDVSYLDKLQNTPENQLGKSDILNAAGAAAMQDGMLTPYYMLINVKIDLSQIFTPAELQALGII